MNIYAHKTTKNYT